jgi:hypothetical protein
MDEMEGTSDGLTGAGIDVCSGRGSDIDGETVGGKFVDGILVGTGTGTATMGLAVGTVTGAPVVGPMDETDGALTGAGIDVCSGRGSDIDGEVDGEAVGGKFVDGILVGTGTGTATMGLVVRTVTGAPVVGPMDEMEGASVGLTGAGIDVGVRRGPEADGEVDDEIVDGDDVG